MLSHDGIVTDRVGQVSSKCLEVVTSLGSRLTGDQARGYAFRKYKKHENTVSDNQLDFTIRVRCGRKLISKRTGTAEAK
jgi:hypothetical protein